MKIEDGWLVQEPGDPEVRKYPSHRNYKLEVPTPLGIVWHYTAGANDDPDARARRIVDLHGNDPSWTTNIGRDGIIYQSNSFLVGSWHVGKAGMIGGQHFSNINHATVGCEMENSGRLKMIDGEWYCWPYWASSDHAQGAAGYCKVESGLAVKTKDGVFESFTDAQVASATVLLKTLVDAYGWGKDVCQYGHVQFDPKNREDPGPWWYENAMPKIIAAVFGDGEVSFENSEIEVS